MEGRRLPTTAAAMDLVAMEFIQDLWEEGEARATASCFLAGLQHELPYLRRQLNGAWRLISAWQKRELPNQCPPMASETLDAVVGSMMRESEVEAAVITAVAWHCLLRTGEAFSLKACDVKASKDGHQMVINLGLTKEGTRHGFNSSVVLEDAGCCQLLGALLLTKRPGEKLFSGSMGRFRAVFKNTCDSLHLGDIG